MRSTSVENKLRPKIQSDVDAFLAKGGEIQKCEIIVRSHRNLTDISQNTNNLRRRDSKRNIGNEGNKKEVTRY